MNLYGNIKKEIIKSPILADGEMINGDTIYRGMRKVGHRVIEMKFDVNPNYPDDKVFISQRTVKIVMDK